MARAPIPELIQFFIPFDPKVQETALLLRAFVLDNFPETNELIYEKSNALAIGYSLSDKTRDMFCHVAVYTKHVNIGFDWGTALDDPEQLLKGTGNRIRHITVTDYSAFPAAYVKKMLEQAHEIAMENLGDNGQSIIGLSVVKSVSEKNKRTS